jgi:hypothetical protein
LIDEYEEDPTEDADNAQLGCNRYFPFVLKLQLVVDLCFALLSRPSFDF